MHRRTNFLIMQRLFFVATWMAALWNMNSLGGSLDLFVNPVQIMLDTRLSETLKNNIGINRPDYQPEKNQSKQKSWVIISDPLIPGQADDSLLFPLKNDNSGFVSLPELSPGQVTILQSHNETVYIRRAIVGELLTSGGDGNDPEPSLYTYAVQEPELPPFIYFSDLFDSKRQKKNDTCQSMQETRCQQLTLGSHKGSSHYLSEAERVPLGDDSLWVFPGPNGSVYIYPEKGDQVSYPAHALIIMNGFCPVLLSNNETGFRQTSLCDELLDDTESAEGNYFDYFSIIISTDSSGTRMVTIRMANGETQTTTYEEYRAQKSIWFESLVDTMLTGGIDHIHGPHRDYYQTQTRSPARLMLVRQNKTDSEEQASDGGDDSKKGNSKTADDNQKKTITPQNQNSSGTSNTATAQNSQADRPHTSSQPSQTISEKAENEDLPANSGQSHVINKSGADQATPVRVDYLASNGNRRTLTSLERDSAKYLALKSLLNFQCQVCFDVYEKPLQTQCCSTFICVFCYLSLTEPKKCPNDRKVFTGSIQGDLKQADRAINNQIEEFVAYFDDVQSIETDTEKSQAQNDAIQKLKVIAQQNLPTSDNQRSSSSRQSNSRTSQHARQNAGDVHSIRVDEGIVLIGNTATILQNSSFDSSSDSDAVNTASDNSMNIRFGGVEGGGFIINGRRVTGRTGESIVFSNRHSVSRGGVTVASPTPQSSSVRHHDFSAHVVHSIDVQTSMGGIVLDKQNSGNQHLVSVISSKEPTFRNGKLDLNCDETVQLKLPDTFHGHLKLHSNMGKIETRNDYSIKSGGKLHSNMGKINVKVDSLLINAKGKTNLGEAHISIRNQLTDIDWERLELKCESNMGDVHIYD